MNHAYIFLTIFFTVYGQLVIKWQVNSAGTFPVMFVDKIIFLVRLLLNPWIASSFLGAFLASLSWIAAMTKFPLSYAYPFVSSTFVLTIIMSSIFFQEAITIPKAIGMGAIIAGIIIGARG